MSPPEWTLVGVHGLVALSGAAAGIFFNLYIFDAAGFEAVIAYQLVPLLLLYALYVVSGYVLRLLNPRGMAQAGLAIQGLVYAAVFAGGHRALDWLVPLAVASGLAQGLFWSGLNVAIYVETNTATRTRFFARIAPVTTWRPRWGRSRAGDCSPSSPRWPGSRPATARCSPGSALPTWSRHCSPSGSPHTPASSFRSATCSTIDAGQSGPRC
ncbi:MAG TPA: hypothetical protein VEK76_05360 [Candidatus Binatia bacterium]|nr:hypothetical protein [Candidatus Binatia bacterium]